MRLNKRYQDGGKPTGRGTASRQDSLNAYNAAVELLQALEDHGYSINELDTSLLPEQKQFVRRLLGDFTSEERAQYEASPDKKLSVREIQQDGGADHRHVYPKDIYEYFDILDRTEEDDVIRSREKTIGTINTQLPLGYYDTRIEPQGFMTAQVGGLSESGAVLPSDIVELPYYDPLAVKPYDMLTEQEKAERLRKYGPEKGMRPVKREQPQPAQRDTIRKVLRSITPPSEASIPVSEYTPEERAAYQEYFDANFPFVDFDIQEFVQEQRASQPQPAPQPAQQQRPAALGLRRMFPLPPPQNQIIATDDRQLKEMLLDERKKGRGAVRIMKADPQMRTGASPDYDVYWDEKRKSWRTRPIPQEEVDRYRKENRIFVTPRISF